MPNILSSKNKGKLVLEMIDFQLSDKFGQDMELHVTDIIASINNGVPPHQVLQLNAVKKIEECIYARLGAKVKIKNTNRVAHISLPHIGLHHVLSEVDINKEEYSKTLKNIYTALDGVKGGVDITNAKLSGFFSKYEHSLYLNFNGMVKVFALSAAEITAIILHELGHVFTHWEYSDRCAKTNQILGNLAKEMAKEKSKRSPVYVFKELLEINPATKKELVDSLVAGDRVIQGPTLFKFAVETVFHQLEDGKYDETSSEALADNFAARFGYARPLVSASKKMRDMFPDMEEHQLKTIVIAAATVLSVLLCILTVFMGAVFLPFLFGFVGMVLSWLLARQSGEGQKDYTYDDVKYRYKRLRDQLVQQIKNKAFDVKDSIHLADDIEYLDELVRTTGQYRSVLDFIMNYIRPSNFRAKKSIERQQLLEDLATNELFIQSLKLQNLATL